MGYFICKHCGQDWQSNFPHSCVAGKIETISTTNPDQKVEKPLMTGWQCPVCGGGNSWTVTRCPCVPIPYNPKQWEITC